MAKYVIWLVALLFLDGCATSQPVEKLSAARTIAVISAFNPAMRGYHPGITAFGNEEWSAENTGFKINDAVLEEVKADANHEVKLVNGEGTYMLPKKPEKDVSAEKMTRELAEKLERAGKEWQVDLIMLICDGTLLDSIGPTDQVLTGFGFYKRAGRESVFWVPQVALFDCRAARFIGVGQILEAQRLPDMGWETSWSAFGAGRQRAIHQELAALIKGTIPGILSWVGLTDKPIETRKRSFASWISFPGANIRPSLTEGNQLEIPPGMPIQSARRAVLAGFRDREWTVTEETEDKIVGVHRDDEDEAICTVSIKNGVVALAPEGYEIKADGKRVPKEYRRWQTNLRESILANLMDGVQSPPQGNRLEVPSGISIAAIRHAIVAGFKDRDWTVTAEADERVTGFYRKGNKEAVCAVTIRDRVIVLAPEGYEIQADGTRVTVERGRWQNNLKESIFQELVEAKTDIVPLSQ